MTEKVIARPENNAKLIQLVRRAYWEASGGKWYPTKRAAQNILCSLRQDYLIVKKEDAA